MRSKLFRPLTGAALACLITSSLEAQKPSQVIRPQAAEESSINPQEAYTPWRWIGVRREGIGECPRVEGWEKKPLLERAQRLLDANKYPQQSRADEALLKELGLDRFCVYTRRDSNAIFRRPPGLVAARPDRLALSETASLEETVSPELARHFRAQTGGDPPLTLRPGAPNVLLTFLDSHPDQSKVSSTPPASGSQHGYTLAQLARQLVCNGPDGPCAADLASHRALNHGNTTAILDLPPSPISNDEGGRVGLVSDLADAITSAVLEWRQSGKPKHLILNISLGWDGELFGDLDGKSFDKLDPDVQVVYQALVFAARRDVLVIAAAGNRRGGPQRSTFPLLPAAWELERPPRSPFRDGSKLIYSVGGVDWQGLPLPNFRHGGCPQRAAYGDHAVAMVGPRPTPIYTGTSVSTVVVSSIAAVVWHLRPELRPDQVMKLIDKSGEPLKPQADFYPKGLFGQSPAPRLQRASLCAAVTEACGTGVGQCPALTSAPACPKLKKTPPQLARRFPDPGPPTSDVIPPAIPFSQPPCDPKPLLWGSAEGASFPPCPTDQFGSVASQRWVFPQPGAVPCPGCSLVPDPPRESASLALNTASPGTTQPYYTLKLEIRSEWLQYLADHSLEKKATLDIFRYNADGTLMKRMTYPISLPSLKKDPKEGSEEVSLTLEGLGDGDSLQGCTAQLNFVVKKDGKTMSIQNPVVVDP